MTGPLATGAAMGAPARVLWRKGAAVIESAPEGGIRLLDTRDGADVTLDASEATHVLAMIADGFDVSTEWAALMDLAPDNGEG